MKLTITIDLPDDDPERLLARLRSLLAAPAAAGSERPHKGHWGPPEGSPAAAPPAASGDLPTSGAQLWGWAKDREGEGQTGLIKWLTRFGKDRGYPSKMTQWNQKQTREALAEVNQARE